MSGFGETLFGGSPFVRWALTPFLALFAVLMPLLIRNWTPLAIAVMIGIEVVCLALLAGFWLPPSLGHVAHRIVAGTVFLFYCVYFVHESLVAKKPFFDDHPGSSPLKALAGLFFIGLPGLWYALVGRFTLRAPTLESRLGQIGGTMVPRLDPAMIPPALRELIPLAERFGITDDVGRELLVLSASPEEIANLKTAIALHEDDLDAWLAGPEADAPTVSAEYLAFSAMRMAADFA